MSSHPVPPRVAVVGAGIAGLAAARRLQGWGSAVTVFEKARGPGGRISTRRRNEASYDHGAQYFTVRDPSFAEAVGAWRAAGVVAVWRPRLGAGFPGRLQPREETTERHVGTPRMSALARHLAEGVDVRSGTRVAPLEREGRGWRLHAEDGRALGTFDAVLVTAPPAQTAALLAAAPALAAAAAAVDLAPCWAAMVHFAAPAPTSFDAAFVEDSPLSWIARGASRPGRAADETWVLHAAPAWSRAHLEDEPDAVAQALLQAFEEVLGAGLPPVLDLDAHRWRYALPPLPREDVLWDRALGLGAGGDWCASARVEGAWLAGRRLALRAAGR